MPYHFTCKGESAVTQLVSQKVLAFINECVAIDNIIMIIPMENYNSIQLLLMVEPVHT